MAHRLFDHTADIGIDADGATHGEALAEAGLALTELVTGKPVHTILPDQEVQVVVEAPDETMLAVAFLAELLWLLESKDLLWLGGGVEVTPQRDGLRAVAKGNCAAYDPDRHGRGVEVKAVTYHGLVSRREGARWHVRVLLDI